MKKKYIAPTTCVVLLHMQQHLLAGSVNASRNDYGTATGDYDQNWE